MRTFLKVAAVLMLSFGAYYLLMGLSAIMASGEIGLVAQSVDETLTRCWRPRLQCSWAL